jgi:hypothetical protein
MKKLSTLLSAILLVFIFPHLAQGQSATRNKDSSGKLYSPSTAPEIFKEVGRAKQDLILYPDDKIIEDETGRDGLVPVGKEVIKHPLPKVK